MASNTPLFYDEREPGPRECEVRGDAEAESRQQQTSPSIENRKPALQRSFRGQLMVPRVRASRAVRHPRLARNRSHAMPHYWGANRDNTPLRAQCSAFITHIAPTGFLSATPLCRPAVPPRRAGPTAPLCRPARAAVPPRRAAPILSHVAARRATQHCPHLACPPRKFPRPRARLTT